MMIIEVGLDKTSRRGKDHFRGNCATDDEIKVVGIEICSGEGKPGRLGRQGGGCLIVTGDASLFNAGPGSDPFVRGFDHFFEVYVIQDFFRQRVSGAY